MLGQVGVGGRHQGQDPAGPRSEQAPSGPQRCRYQGQGEGERQGVGGELGGPEEGHPRVQQQVVEWRGAVDAQDAGYLRQRVRRDADGDALVDPQPSAGSLQAEQEGGHHQGGEQRDDQGWARPRVSGHRLGDDARRGARVRGLPGHQPGTRLKAGYGFATGAAVRFDHRILIGRRAAVWARLCCPHPIGSTAASEMQRIRLVRRHRLSSRRYSSSASARLMERKARRRRMSPSVFLDGGLTRGLAPYHSASAPVGSTAKGRPGFRHRVLRSDDAAGVRTVAGPDGRRRSGRLDRAWPWP